MIATWVTSFHAYTYIGPFNFRSCYVHIVSSRSRLAAYILHEPEKCHHSEQAVITCKHPLVEEKMYLKIPGIQSPE